MLQIPVLFALGHIVICIIGGREVAGADTAANHRETDTLVIVKQLGHQHISGFLRQTG